MKHSVRIGTSGWNYPHWQGPFYPQGSPKSKWLEYYTEHFDTVELNATFYRLPKPDVFRNWHDRTPSSFLWSLKASRYLTHVRRLEDPEEPLKRLYDACHHLRVKLGPILFQLPPNLVYHENLLKTFLGYLDPSCRHVMEVRHASWLNNTFLSHLEKYNIAFCISETAGRYPYSEAVTADFVYIRLHGTGQLYKSLYSEEELNLWADKISGWHRETFVYFDNDFECHAVPNALRLKALLGV